jgi:hypothetical protein
MSLSLLLLMSYAGLAVTVVSYGKPLLCCTKGRAGLT